MLGHRMRKLFVKGEVVNVCETDEGTHCMVVITNDGWHVCKTAFFVQDIEDLEEQFYDYLESDEFQRKLRG